MSLALDALNSALSGRAVFGAGPRKLLCMVAMTEPGLTWLCWYCSSPQMDSLSSSKHTWIKDSCEQIKEITLYKDILRDVFARILDIILVLSIFSI